LWLHKFGWSPKNRRGPAGAGCGVAGRSSEHHLRSGEARFGGLDSYGPL